MAIRQYIGARYVPIFDGDWDITKDYDPLVIVSNAGNSYTSKTYVPHGVDITDTTYWACTGNYNAQVESYRQEVIALSGDVSDLDDKVDLIAGKTVLHKDTVSDMSADADLVAGDVVQTLGYHSENDGGAALYLITDTEPATYYESVGALYAQLIVGSAANVKQFGAYGDNTHDDITAFNNAIAASHVIYIPAGSYKLSDNLEIPSKYFIYGDGTYNTDLQFDNHGFITQGEWITLKDFKVEGQSNGTGLSMINNVHYVSVENIHINGFENAILKDASASFWNCTFKGVRMYDNAHGIKVNKGFCITFENCYTNKCTEALKLQSLKASFIGCNFGIRTPDCIDISDICILVFDECNFECDVQVAAGTIIWNAGGNIDFRGCLFHANGTSTTYWFGFYSGNSGTRFELCQHYTATGSGMDGTKILNPAKIAGSKYGTIIFDDASLPYPSITGLSTNVVPYLINRATVNMIEFFGTSVDKTKLTAGQILNHYNANATYDKVCYFNGTNVVDFAGNTIV